MAPFDHTAEHQKVISGLLNWEEKESKQEDLATQQPLVT